MNNFLQYIKGRKDVQNKKKLKEWDIFFKYQQFVFICSNTKYLNKAFHSRKWKLFISYWKLTAAAYLPTYVLRDLCELVSEVNL